jgi:carbamoyl-phosphate synthase large subunit
MPRRTDISSILIIGAGPIVIGQACEFDYSGTQALKALKAEGYRIVLVNSNPATIMTDPELADATYIEPITPEIVAKIIEKERNVVAGGFALLPTMGGQTALNTALSLNKMGVLERFDVTMIGATAQAIDKAEDRERFREAMQRIGLETPRSKQVKTLIHALEALEDIGLPAIIRPSFTLGGTGGGIAYNKAEFIDIVERGIDASPTNEVLIEESVLGWKESRWRWCATNATIASSSARSRTSIPWACIPAIRSRSRPRSRSPTRNTRSCATPRSRCCARSGSRPAARTCSSPSIPQMDGW